MKSYDLSKDLKRMLLYFNITQQQLASDLAISRMSLSRYLKNETTPDARILEAIYGYAYKKGLLFNSAKADFFYEDKGTKTLLFHGASGEIVGEVDTKHSKLPNDFGNGFYAGETFGQSASWVCEAPSGSVYCFYSENERSLTKKTFRTDREWMYAILYYRGAFRHFEPTEEVMELVRQIEACDLIVAPIADNQMYQIMNRFADNVITDEQCIHALSATHLGMQYVFKSMAACAQLHCIERLFLCQEEKRDYANRKKVAATENASKAELAIVEYRRKGKYFDELFTRIG